MASIGNLSINLSIDSSMLPQQAKQAASYVKALQNNVMGDNFLFNIYDPSGKGGKQIGLLANAIGFVKSQALMATVAIGGLMVVGMGTAVRLAAEAEQAEIAFGAMMNSAAKGSAVVREIRAMALDRPIFSTSDLMGAAKRLTAYGSEASKIIPTLKVLGDISAGTGKDLQELTIIFGQIRSTGKLLGQDSNQLAQANIPILEELAKHYGKTTGEVLQMREAGLITFNDVAATLQKMTLEGGRFFGLTEKMGASTLGKWRSLKTAFEQALMGLGGEIAVKFNLSDILTNAKSAMSEIGNIAGVMSKEFNAAFETIRVNWGDVAMFLGKTTTQVISLIVDAVKLVGGSIAKLIEGLLLLYSKVKGFASDREEVEAWAASYGEVADALLNVRPFENLQKIGVIFDNAGKKAKEAALNVKGLGNTAEDISMMVPPAQMFADALKLAGDNAQGVAEKLKTMPILLHDALVQGLAMVKKVPLGIDFKPPTNLKITTTNLGEGPTAIVKVMEDMKKLQNEVMGPVAEKKMSNLRIAFLETFSALKVGDSNTRKLGQEFNYFINSFKEFGAGELPFSKFEEDLIKMEVAINKAMPGGRRGLSLDTRRDRDELLKMKEGLDEIRKSAGLLGEQRGKIELFKGLQASFKEIKDSLTQAALKTTEDMTSPYEKLAGQLTLLRAQFLYAGLGADSYALAVAKAIEAAEKAAGIGDIKLPQIAEQGSAEAVSAINRQRLGVASSEARIQTLWETMAADLKRLLEEARKTTAAVDRVGVPSPAKVGGGGG